MALWCRIKHPNVRCLSLQICRTYFQIKGSSLSDYTVSKTLIRKYPDLFRPKGLTEFACNARFFAAPVQVNPKKEKKNDSGTRINEQITAQQVRVIIDEGGCVQNHIVTLSAALKRARELKLDLVEVQATAIPPVCKIMDFHREKYKKQEEAKKRAKITVKLRVGSYKEIKFTKKTELKDLKMKADMVKRMMERGYRVRCVAESLVKRTEDEDDMGERKELSGLLSRFSELIEDVALIESGPLVEKSKAYMLVRHVKFGPLKKGQKGSKAAGASSAKAQKKQNKTDDEFLSEEENDEVDKGAWSVKDTDDNFEQLFDLGNEAERVNTVPSFPEAPLVNENRFERSELQSRYAPTKPAAGRFFPNVNESARVEPRLRNASQVGADPGIFKNSRLPNGAPGVGPPHIESTSQVGADPSISKNSRVPNGVRSQGPSQMANSPSPPASGFGIFSAPIASDASVRPGVAAEGTRNKEGTSQTAKTPSFGIFSAPKARNAASVIPGVAAEGFRKKEGPSQMANTPDPPASGYGIADAQNANRVSARPGDAAGGIRNKGVSPTPGPRALPTKSNPPPSRTDNSQRPGADGNGRRQWGAFSGG